MDALIVVGIVVVLALALLWARSAAARRERRSVRRYEEALGILGNVARRSDASAPVHLPDPSAVARPHVDTPGESALRPVEEEVVRPRIRLEPPAAFAPSPTQGFSAADGAGESRSRGAAALARMVTRARAARDAAPTVADSETVGDQATVDPEVPTIVASFSDVDVADSSAFDVVGSRAAKRSLSSRRPVGATRRLAFAAVPVLVIGAVVGVVATHAHTPPGPKVNAPSKPPHKSSHRTTSTTPTTLPTVLTPASSTTDLVVYDFPASASTNLVVSFQATAPCWLGAQHTTNGSYLWMDTLGAGESATFSSSGPLVVRLGAPGYVSVVVNGITVQLPSGRKNPYDIEFELTS